MKILRFLALLMAVLAAYTAQWLFTHPAPLEAIPSAWLDRLPVLRSTLGWTPENLRNLAFFLASLGALIYGLAALPWQWTLARRPSLSPAAATARSAKIGWGLVLLALGLSAVLAFLWSPQAETLFLQWTWLALLILFGVGCAWLRPPSERARRCRARTILAPTAAHFAHRRAALWLAIGSAAPARGR